MLEDAPSSPAAQHVRVHSPAAAAVLLQLAAAPSTEASEQAAVLGMLCLLCESSSLPKQVRQSNQDLLSAAPCCWQQLLLDCMAAHSSSAPSAEAAPAEAAAAAAAWRLLVLLLSRGIAASAAGWQRVQAVVSLLKTQPERAFLCPDASVASPAAPSPPLVSMTAWQLLQLLLSDVMLELLAAQAADAAGSPRGGAEAASPKAAAQRQQVRRTSSEWDAWTVVSPVRPPVTLPESFFKSGNIPEDAGLLAASSYHACVCVPPPLSQFSQWATEPYCGNAAALVGLVEELLASAVLPQSPGERAAGCMFPALLDCGGAVRKCSAALPMPAP